MPNNVIVELEANEQVYDIYGKATANANNGTSNHAFIFDWVGNQQEYVDQQIEESHPDWLCFITDDIEGGHTVYTKSEVNEMFVYKNQNDTVTGTKTFQSNDDGVSLVTKSQTIDSTQTPATTQYSNYIENEDINGALLSRIFTAKNTNGENVIAIEACDGVQNAAVQVTSAGNCILPLDTYGTNFHGTASSALWADLAEKYETDSRYDAGTLIKFGGEKDITIADTKCNGVISDKPGFLLDAGQKGSMPIALVGKTPVRIIGKVKRFDPITLSETPGVGRVAKSKEKIIARTLEASDVEEEKLVMCVTKFSLD